MGGFKYRYLSNTVTFHVYTNHICKYKVLFFFLMNIGLTKNSKIKNTYIRTFSKFIKIKKKVLIKILSLSYLRHNIKCGYSHKYLYMRRHTHIYTYIHKYTNIHEYTHTQHIYEYTLTYIYMNTHTHEYSHTYMNTHTHK